MGKLENFAGVWAPLAVASLVSGCAPRLEDATSVEPMACAAKMEDISGLSFSDEVALTRGAYSAYTGNKGELECHLQPYVAYDPEHLENLEPDQVQDMVHHRLVGFAFPAEETVGTAVNKELLAAVDIVTDCAELGIPETAPLCVAFCPDWEGGSNLTIGIDECERVVEIDGDDTDRFY